MTGGEEKDDGKGEEKSSSAGKAKSENEDGG